MARTKPSIQRLMRPIFRASAIGFVLSAAPALAADEASNTQAQFQQLDRNADQKLEWKELEPALKDNPQAQNLTRQQLMERFDSDQDLYFSAIEFSELINTLTTETTRGKSFPNLTASEQPPTSTTVTRQSADSSQQGAEDVGTLPATAAGIPPNQAEGKPIDLATLEELQNLPVMNSNGEQIGEVDHFVIAKSNADAGVVVLVDGLWGTAMGAKEVLAPLSALRLETGKVIWQTMQSKHDIKKSASFEKEQYTPVATSEYATVGEVKDKVSD